MDFKRISTILIIFYIIFDIYLILLLLTRAESLQTNPQPVETVNIIQTLQERDVKITAELEETYPDRPQLKTNKTSQLPFNIDQLEGQTTTVLEGGISSVFDEPQPLGVDLSNTEVLTPDQEAVITEQWLSQPQRLIQGQAYQDFRWDPVSRHLVIRMYAIDQQPVADGTAEINLELDEAGQVIGYTQTYQEGFHALESVDSLISSKEALSILDSRSETYLPDDSTIKRVTMSYYRAMNLDDFDIYSPVWEISYELPDQTTQNILIDAIRGRVINPSTYQNVLSN